MSEDQAEYEVGPGPGFFPVSALKLVVMSIVTFGIYELYWFYKNWKIVRIRTDMRMLPFWRAFFANFFCYSLFLGMRQSFLRSGTKVYFVPAINAIAWIGLMLSEKLPDPYWFIWLASVLALVPVQLSVNNFLKAENQQYNPNSKFTTWNFIGIAFGGLVLMLAIWGTYFPDTFAD